MIITDEIKINSIDVTEYRKTWDFYKEWDIAIDQITIVLSPSVLDFIDVETGLSLTIKRGFSIVSEDFVFNGIITLVEPATDKVTVTAKGKLQEMIKEQRVKSWDIDIDTEAGVGSEIAKNIITHSHLLYNSSSIVSTGTTADRKIQKFIQNDEDDYQKMNELCKTYNYSLTLNYNDDLVYFQPKGYNIYSSTLTVGTDIPGRIRWKENMEQLCNYIKVYGATVYDTYVETFAGPDTTFDLLKTPEDTEVRVGTGDETGTLKTRGAKGVGTLGTDYDYYVDTENKMLVFATNQSDVWIRYGTQVPMPVIVKDNTSITKYGGSLGTPTKKKITYTDIKDLADAEARGRAYLAKYAQPFIEASEIPVSNEIIQTYGFIEPGDMITVIDPFLNITRTVLVKIVHKSFPHTYDRITIGDEIWRTEDWQQKQMEKINQLYNELNKNEQILTSVVDINRYMSYGRRYFNVQKRAVTSGVFLVGHQTLGLVGGYIGTGTLSFVLGHPIAGILGSSALGDNSSTFSTIRLVQGNNIYAEMVYDNLFFDTDISTCTFDYTNRVITFANTNEFYSNKIMFGSTVSKASNFIFNGTDLNNLTFYISNDNGSTYELLSPTFNSGNTQSILTLHNFVASSSAGIKIKIVATGAATLESDYDDDYIAISAIQVDLTQ